MRRDNKPSRLQKMFYQKIIIMEKVEMQLRDISLSLSLIYCLDVFFNAVAFVSRNM